MIDNWRILGVFFLVSTAQAGWNAAPQKPDCEKCPLILQDLDVLKKQQILASNDLVRAQDEVKALTGDQPSKKRQLTSRLFIVAAKSETAQNLYAHKQKDWVFNCSHCGSK